MLIILFNINPFFAFSEVVASIVISKIQFLHAVESFHLFLLLFLSANLISRHNRRNMICFPYRLFSSLSTLLCILITFLCLFSVKLVIWRKQKIPLLLALLLFYAIKFACLTNLILPETRWVSYKFLFQKWLSFFTAGIIHARHIKLR